MNYEHLKAFIQIADRNSISATAKELFITPVSLLQQINLLEREVGFPVFIRSRKGVSLTAAGHKLYDGARIILEDTDALLTECRDIAHNDALTISVSVYKPYDFMRFSDAYNRMHPNIIFRYGRAEPLITNRLSFHLSQNGFDIIQTEYNPDAETDDIAFLPICNDRLCCICADTHPLSKRSSIPLQALEGLTLSTFSNSGYAMDALEKSIQENRLHIRLSKAIYSDYAVLKCCANGGIYILEEKLAHSFDHLGVIPLAPEFPFIHGIVYLRKGKPAVLDFIDFIQKAV